MKLQNTVPEQITHDAIKGSFGDVTYFLTTLDLRDAAENLQLFPQDKLSFRERIQRVLNEDRVKNEILPYLLQDKDRFFNSLVCILLPDANQAEGYWDFKPYEDDGGNPMRVGSFKIAKRVARVVLDGQHRFRALSLYWERAQEELDGLSKTMDIPVAYVVIDSLGQMGVFWEQARVLREIGDHDGALKALEHVTLLNPDHVGALALLGEVNIRRGQFEEAAASLGRLASLEGAPAKNRVTAGVAAVDLYENKLRRFDKALDVLLTLHAAKLSTLPVRERLAKAAARNADWTVATSALEELMNERPERAGRIEAARLAMVIHRDRLGAQGALAAVVKLLSELPSDDEALELLLRIDVPSELQRELLVQARRSLVELLRQHPMDPSRARRLFDVAQALGDDRLAQATLGALAALGASNPGTQQAFAQIASRKPRTPQVAATDAVLRAILAPGDEGPLADLFALLGPTLAEALGPNLATCGVGRRDRIDPRSGLALRNEIASWAGALRLNELELYVGGKDPAGVQGVAGEPPALIVGVGINSPLAPLTRGRVARELLALARGTTIVRWRDDLAIAAIVIAACRFADVRIEHPPYAILAEIERLLGRALTRKTRRLLPEVCSAIVAHRGEARAWSQRALASHDRMAVVASGDPSVVLGDILAMPVDQLGQAVAGNPRAEELLRFVFSPAYIDVRSALGLEGDGP